MKSKRILSTRELAVFAMLGAVMFVGDLAFEWAPNVHPVTMLAMVYTVAYRRRGIVPILVYLALQAVFFGGVWLVPYFYIFPLFWLLTLCVPKRLSGVRLQVVLTLLCTLFGFLFGILYAPWQALVFMKSADLERIFAWVLAGLPYDGIHALGNFAASFLILPLVKLLKRIENKSL